MAATTVTDAGSVRIITEVIPATDPRAAQLALGSQSPAPARTSFQTQSFRRAHPKVLGTIHIFTGIIHICFGIILTASQHGNPSLPVASGILFWLGILLLVSGSLLVESERRDSLALQLPGPLHSLDSSHGIHRSRPAVWSTWALSWARWWPPGSTARPSPGLWPAARTAGPSRSARNGASTRRTSSSAAGWIPPSCSSASWNSTWLWQFWRLDTRPSDSTDTPNWRCSHGQTPHVVPHPGGSPVPEPPEMRSARSVPNKGLSPSPARVSPGVTRGGGRGVSPRVGFGGGAARGVPVPAATVVGGAARHKHGGAARHKDGGRSPSQRVLPDRKMAAGEPRRVDHGGGDRGRPGTGIDPRGSHRGRLGSGPGPAAAERRKEAAGGGGGHPAGQAQVGTGVEGSREEEVLPHDPGQGAPHLLGTENEGEAGEKAGPGSGTAAGGGEAEGERGEEAAAGGEPEAAPGKRAESRDCPSDPEPPEAQAGQEEAAEEGGKEGYTGPAPEDAREARHGHGMRRELGCCRA